jgi:nucleoside 2-deoxyribosyltransferase-like protein
MKSQYIEAPNYEKILYKESVFLAGGITNVMDWQSIVCDKLKDEPITIVNPRRKDFDLKDGPATVAQIKWEYKYLRRVNSIIFWFSNETIQPISLFELGGALEREQNIFIGWHPEYSREKDLCWQLYYGKYWVDKDIKIANDIDTVVQHYLKQIRP